MKYLPTSPEGIASFFEYCAERENEKAGFTRRDKEVIIARKNTWLSAADFIKNCDWSNFKIGDTNAPKTRQIPQGNIE